MEGVISSRGFPSVATEGKLHCLANSIASLGHIKQRSTDFEFRFFCHLSFVIRASSFSSHLEAFAQIKLAADGIVDEKILCAFALDASIVNQIRAVHDGKRLADVVIGDHDGQS